MVARNKGKGERKQEVGKNKDAFSVVFAFSKPS